ncbi:MAG TPA: DUF2070 family protein, partial [Thermoplasmata archaeon]|nr:DUF2070 family protein [Thermoplasmata archaeon]
MSADSVPFVGPPTGPRSRNRRLLFRAPSAGQSVGLIVVESVLLALLFEWPPEPSLTFLLRWLALFLFPPLLAGLLTGPIAAPFGGRLSIRRSLLLSVTAGSLPIPIALAWRAVQTLDPSALPDVAAILLFVQGPVLWFREMSLFGVSNPSHLRSLPPALASPLLSVAAVLAFYPPTASLLIQGALYLLIGFLACALLLRAADRPMKREFGVSGVSLIRPMLDHINERDPAATEMIERFFAKFSVSADLSVRLLTFGNGSSIKATLALPTVHPGPFGALGASDLPRRLAERLGPEAGVVLVPHTPCNHDQDLPTSRDFERVAEETRALWKEVVASPPSGGAAPSTSPLVGRDPASFARVQLLGGVALAVVTQAPAPTDDIALSVVEPVVRRIESSGGPKMAVVDAHNSYIEDQGDISYATPAAVKLSADLEGSVSAAQAAARPGPIRVGVAARAGFSLGEDGIGPHGIRVLAVETAGTRTAYILLDGNNLVTGLRATLLSEVRGVVDAA